MWRTADLWRGMQRVIAALLLPAAVLPVIVCGLLIRMRSPGRMIIIQYREGLGGKPFRMLKLRTMDTNARDRLSTVLATGRYDEWRRFGWLENDPRIAGRVARLARRYSIDELPQLLNIVRGEMALVGPRPLPPESAAQMRPADLDARRAVLPGLTGLWQVSGRGDLDLQTMGELDSVYVRRRSLRLDVTILVKTFRAVLSGRGAY